MCREEIDLGRVAYQENNERHVVFKHAFLNMDELGEQELVLIESGIERFQILTINQVQENSQCRILSESLLQNVGFKLLVGDIDGDAKDKMVLHRTANSWDEEHEETAWAIEFESGRYHETRIESLVAERGVLIDFDNDGKQEILIGVFTEIIPMGEGLHPTEMRLYSYDQNEFQLLTTYSTGDTTIQSVPIGDVDSDRRYEIVTQEVTHDGERVH